MMQSPRDMEELECVGGPLHGSKVWCNVNSFTMMVPTFPAVRPNGLEQAIEELLTYKNAVYQKELWRRADGTVIWKLRYQEPKPMVEICFIGPKT
jgi:hypothetical protein